MSYRKNSAVEAEKFIDPNHLPAGVLRATSASDDHQEFFVIAIHGANIPVLLGDWIVKLDSVYVYPMEEAVFFHDYRILGA